MSALDQQVLQCLQAVGSEVEATRNQAEATLTEMKKTVPGTTALQPTPPPTDIPCTIPPSRSGPTEMHSFRANLGWPCGWSVGVCACVCRCCARLGLQRLEPALGRTHGALVKNCTHVVFCNYLVSFHLLYHVVLKASVAFMRAFGRDVCALPRLWGAIWPQLTLVSLNQKWVGHALDLFYVSKDSREWERMANGRSHVKLQEPTACGL
jgi:hypothetical protein